MPSTLIHQEICPGLSRRCARLVRTGILDAHLLLAHPPAPLLCHSSRSVLHLVPLHHPSVLIPSGRTRPCRPVVIDHRAGALPVSVHHPFGRHPNGPSRGWHPLCGASPAGWSARSLRRCAPELGRSDLRPLPRLLLVPGCRLHTRAPHVWAHRLYRRCTTTRYAPAWRNFSSLVCELGEEGLHERTKRGSASLSSDAHTSDGGTSATKASMLTGVGAFSIPA